MFIKVRWNAPFFMINYKIRLWPISYTWYSRRGVNVKYRAIPSAHNQIGGCARWGDRERNHRNIRKFMNRWSINGLLSVFKTILIWNERSLLLPISRRCIVVWYDGYNLYQIFWSIYLIIAKSFYNFCEKRNGAGNKKIERPNNRSLGTMVFLFLWFSRAN